MIKIIKHAQFVIFFTFFAGSVYCQENIARIALSKKFENFTPYFFSESRHDEDQRRVLFRDYNFGIQVPFQNNWSVMAHYQAIDRFNDKTKKIEREKRPAVILQKVFDTDLASVEVRTRQEYNYLANNTQTMRNRSRILLTSNKSFFNLKPFLGNEIFYNFDQDRLIANRFEVGAFFPKTKYGHYSFFYRYEVSESAVNKRYWEAKDSVALSVAFDF